MIILFHSTILQGNRHFVEESATFEREVENIHSQPSRRATVRC